MKKKSRLPGISTAIFAVLFLAQVSQAVCHELSMWNSTFPTYPDQRFEINVSGSLTIPFDFSHSYTAGDASCASLIRSYDVSVNGLAMPAWMTLNYLNNNGAPSIVVT